MKSSNIFWSSTLGSACRSILNRYWCFDDNEDYWPTLLLWTDGETAFGIRGLLGGSLKSSSDHTEDSSIISELVNENSSNERASIFSRVETISSNFNWNKQKKITI